MDLETLKNLKPEDWQAFEDRFPEAVHFLNRQALYREWLSLRLEAQRISLNDGSECSEFVKMRLAMLNPIFDKKVAV